MYSQYFQFGLCIPDVNFPDSQNTVECLAVMDEADKNFNSWTYWNRDVWDNEGNIKPDTAIAFARPYPMATSGIPKEVIQFKSCLYQRSFMIYSSIVQPGDK